MKIFKNLCMVLCVSILVILVMPNVSKAAVEVTRNVYSNNGSMKFTFTGLILDVNHTYEFGLKSKLTDTITKWHPIDSITETEIKVNINTINDDLKTVFNSGDTGYITIRDVTTIDEPVQVLEDYKVDLKIPYLRVTNFKVVANGFNFDDRMERDQCAL